jgi:tol-pal system protein YbgF
VRVWVVLSLLLAAAACTSQEDMALLHREITDVQRQVQSLQSSSLDRTDLGSVEQRVEEQTGKMMRSNADLAARVDMLQEQIEALQSSLELTTHRLQRVSQELAAARALRVEPDTLPPATAAGDDGALASDSADASRPVASATLPSTPEELYRSAYEDYMRGNYDLAAQGFLEYLRRWNDTDLADNALYWVGECYDAQDRHEEALEAFSQVLEQFPASDKAAAAQLKKGLVYLDTGDQGQGVVQLQYVVYEHPGTREADLAREKLRSLGITIR